MRILTLFLILFSVCLSAQNDTIRIENGSFGGEPRVGSFTSSSIESWYDCGAVQFPEENAPDIHPMDYWLQLSR